MMKILFALIFLNLASILQAEPIMLVSDEEVKASHQNKSFIQSKAASAAASVSDAPKIELINPQLGSNINSPTPIELKFNPKSPAIIKPESFKALYGSFQIDITKRLLNVAQVTQQGIQVTEANLPKGHHKITMNIEDSEGRIGSKTMEFEIK